MANLSIQGKTLKWEGQTTTKVSKTPLKKKSNVSQAAVTKKKKKEKKKQWVSPIL